MDSNEGQSRLPSHVLTSGRIIIATMAICCLCYGLLILCLGELIAPKRAEGSLIRDEKGVVIGSELIAQNFARPGYFWPRPSAVNYDASASGGSNLSPANPEVRKRAEAIIAKIGISGGKPIPADLVTTSGSGLDPHITFAAAEYQAERVASARGIPLQRVIKLLHENSGARGGIPGDTAVVNVLEINILLDGMERKDGQ
jgi:potassium-transporting ATPase KdpC subunit